MIINYTKNDIFKQPLLEKEVNMGNYGLNRYAVCVTTNGIIKANGEAVMGKGIALTANNQFHIAKELASKLRATGNHVYRMESAQYCDYHLLTFPTKQDWKQPSNLNLILQSAKELIAYCDQNHIVKCFLTPPGCSCGQLSWETQVKPLLQPLLDDRFEIIIREV